MPSCVDKIIISPRIKLPVAIHDKFGSQFTYAPTHFIHRYIFSTRILVCVYIYIYFISKKKKM